MTTITQTEYDKRTADLAQREATIKSALQGAQNDRDRAAFAGKDTAGADAEIAGYGKALADIEGSRRHLAELFRASTAKARADALALQLDGAKLYAEKHVAAGKALDAALAKFHAALLEYTRTAHGTFAALADGATLAGVDVDALLAIDPRRAGLDGVRQALHDALTADREAGGVLGQFVTLPGFEQRPGASAEGAARDAASRIAGAVRTWKTK